VAGVSDPMKVERIFVGVIFFGIWCYINYQIYIGMTTGIFNPFGKGIRLVSYSESPIFFCFSMGVTIIFSLIFMALIVSSIYSVVDRKVRAYGGNYNINTFKAIIRGLVNDH
jgi:uncharacterized membrane protein